MIKKKLVIIIITKKELIANFLNLLDIIILIKIDTILQQITMNKLAFFFTGKILPTCYLVKNRNKVNFIPFPTN